MKERPILFSAPMVRAILEGRKTQTRRIIKPQPEPMGHGDFGLHPKFGGGRKPLTTPYGIPGDRLWVKETYLPVLDCPELPCQCEDEGPVIHRLVLYRATDEHRLENWRYSDDEDDALPAWKPSIHMKREYSRITLEVAGVRAERLWDISNKDAWAEGCREFPDHPGKDYSSYWALDPDGGAPLADTPRDEFAGLWRSIHGDGSWQENPWVWVIELKRVEQAEQRRTA